MIHLFLFVPASILVVLMDDGVPFPFAWLFVLTAVVNLALWFVTAMRLVWQREVDSWYDLWGKP